MAENTNIEWCDHTFNPWEGCTKVGPGCDHCYAETRNNRFGGGNWGPGAPRRRTSETNWKKPLKWNREAEAKGVRYRVFCASLADVFDNEANSSWRDDLFFLIQASPNLDWLLLTKRVGNVMSMVPESWKRDFPDNVWLGATIVNQAEADRDIPKLLEIPAAVRFLSMEPLLGSVDLTSWIGGHVGVTGYRVDPKPHWIDWVIVGGESGTGARPMHPDWVRDLRDQCNAAGTAYFFKQWGSWGPNWLNDDYGYKITASEWMEPMGKKRAGRTLDGRTWDEFPKGANT